MISSRGASSASGVLVKRVAFAVFLCCFFPAFGEAQNVARNAVYFELGGSGIVPTINYERNVRGQWFGRVGLSLVVGEGENDTDTTLVVPLTLSSVSRPLSNHHLELGGGLTLIGGERQDLLDDAGEDEDFSAVVITGLAGYRYQRPGRGFQFRAVFTPALSGSDVLPWAGVSFGYAW